MDCGTQHILGMYEAPITEASFDNYHYLSFQNVLDLIRPSSNTHFLLQYQQLNHICLLSGPTMGGKEFESSKVMLDSQK